jgi:hypothetical protein
VAARIAGAHATTTRSYPPTAYTILSGSVYRNRGGLSRLYYDDDSRLEIQAAKGSSGYASDIYVSGSVDPAALSTLQRLSIDYNGNASGSSTAVTLTVYDWSTGRWVTVDGSRTGVTTDRSFSWSATASAANYVSPAGEVRLRISGTNASAFRTRTDLVHFTVEY